MSNLVDNAIRHNHRGGWIEVTTAGGAGHAIVNVRNSGDAVPAADVDRLFEPFQRMASGVQPPPRPLDRRPRTTLTAEPIRPSGQPEESVSFILIPPTAAPGYYNLITSVTEPPGSHGGASIIHVIPKT